MIGATIMSLVGAAFLFGATQKLEWWTPLGCVLVAATIAAIFVFATHFYAQATETGTFSSFIFQVFLVSLLVPVAFAALVALNALAPLHVGRSNEAEWAVVILGGLTWAAGCVVTPLMGAFLSKSKPKERPDGQT